MFGWPRSRIPDQQGRHAVITGGGSGIGFEVARQLLEHGASVTIASRNLEMTRQAARDLQEEFPGAEVAACHLDLEDLRSVEAFATHLLDSGRPIHLLINMAGRFLDAPFELTPDGIEVTRASVYWGHVYLTLLLLPQLRGSAPARVINMTSVMELAGWLDFGDLKGDRLRTSGAPAYATAKLLLLLFSQELQRRLRLTGDDVECFAVQPGLVASALGNKVSLAHPFTWISLLAWRLLAQSPLQGAQSTVFAATEPSLAGKGGSYVIGPQYSTWLFHSTLRWPRSPYAWHTHKNADNRRRLWEESVWVLEGLVQHPVDTLPGTPPPVGRLKPGRPSTRT